jgi:hypothetical protein
MSVMASQAFPICWRTSPRATSSSGMPWKTGEWWPPKPFGIKRVGKPAGGRFAGLRSIAGRLSGRCICVRRQLAVGVRQALEIAERALTRRCLRHFHAPGRLRAWISSWGIGLLQRGPRNQQLMRPPASEMRGDEPGSGLNRTDPRSWSKTHCMEGGRLIEGAESRGVGLCPKSPCVSHPVVTDFSGG